MSLKNPIDNTKLHNTKPPENLFPDWMQGQVIFCGEHDNPFFYLPANPDLPCPRCNRKGVSTTQPNQRPIDISVDPEWQWRRIDGSLPYQDQKKKAASKKKAKSNKTKSNKAKSNKATSAA